MPTIDDLSKSAQIAYRAFLDMGESKAAHFNYLVELEEKYKLGGTPGVVENRQLAELLTRHDKNVQAFKTAMSAVTDSEEKQILFQLFS